MGVHFRLGGAAGVLGMPAGETTARVVELSSIWCRPGLELLEALLEAGTPAEKLKVLELFLLKPAKRGRRRSPAILHALQRFSMEPGVLSIATVADEFGVESQTSGPPIPGRGRADAETILPYSTIPLCVTGHRATTTGGLG